MEKSFFLVSEKIHIKGGNDEETMRESRRFLSKSQAVPGWLLEKYPAPEWALIHHTVHKDSTLPLFQARLQNNETFEGKHLDSKSETSCCDNV